MVFLESLLNISNQTGLLPSLHKKNRLYILRTVINFTGALSIIFHCGWFYFIHNKTDFLQATFALGMCMIVLVHVTKLCVLLSKNDEFVAVYLRVKRFYDDPTLYRNEIRDTMDKNLQFYSRNILRFVVMAMICVILNPVIVKSIEYVQTGAIVKSRWDLPIPFASPFYDLQVSPAYEIVYMYYVCRELRVRCVLCFFPGFPVYGNVYSY